MRDEGIKRRNETRSALWEVHFRDPIVALDKKVCGRSVPRLMLARGFCGIEVVMTCGSVGSVLILPLREKVFWLFLDAWDSVRLRTASTQWNVPGRYGPHGELFFFLVEERAEGLGPVSQSTK